MKRLIFPLFLFSLLLMGCDKLPSKEQVNSAKNSAQSAVEALEEPASVVADKAKEAYDNREAIAGTTQAHANTVADKAQEIYDNRDSILGTVEAGASIAAEQASILATRINEDGGTTIDQLKALGTPAITLGTRMQSIWPDENGIVTVKITEAELTSALVWDSAEEDKGFRNVRVSIGDGVIVIKGDVVDPIQAVGEIVILPTINNGDIVLQTQSAQVGKLPLPKTFINIGVNRLTNTLLTPLKFIPGNIVFTAVYATGGELTIEGIQQ